MKGKLAICAAVVLLVAKACALYMLFGTVDHYRPLMFVVPGLYLAAAAWLWLRPQWARWPVGAFFLYAALRETAVFFQGSTFDMVRRPFSLALAGWFAWVFLTGRGLSKIPAKSDLENTRT